MRFAWNNKTIIYDTSEPNPAKRFSCVHPHSSEKNVCNDCTDWLMNKLNDNEVAVPLD